MTSEIRPGDLGKITFVDEQASIEFQRFYAHVPEKVWAAITDNSRLASWFITKVRIEPGLGGLVESWFGFPPHHVMGKIKVWDPPHLLEHEWNIEPSQALPDGEFSIMRWELERVNGGTILTLKHRNLTRQTVSGIRRGLDPAPAEHLILDRLEAYLSSNPASNTPARMNELMAEYHKMLHKPR